VQQNSEAQKIVGHRLRGYWPASTYACLTLLR